LDKFFAASLWNLRYGSRPSAPYRIEACGVVHVLMITAWPITSRTVDRLLAFQGCPPALPSLLKMLT
jgi:hypothetical protein